MIPMVTFTGFSGSGKTTVVESVIKELTQRGYKVSSIKHDGHCFDIDKKGSDSFRHKEAGAICSIISSPDKFAVISDSKTDMTPHQLASYIPIDTDIVICEGFKNSAIKKIEVVRKAHNTERANENDPLLIAVATDYPALIKDKVEILDLNSTTAIADFIINHFLQTSPDITLQLVVNGQSIPTKDFILEMLSYSVQGLIKPLKGCSNPTDITIKVIYNKNMEKVNEL